MNRDDYIKFFDDFFVVKIGDDKLGIFFPKYFMKFLKENNIKYIDDMTLIQCKKLYNIVDRNERNKWKY